MRGRVAAIVVLCACGASTLSGQAPEPRPSYSPPKNALGQPDVSGVWQALNSAAWDIEGHAGATGVPAGRSVVEGGTIPYRPEALQKRKDNFARRRTLDPESKCWLPGVPRITYMPYPFHILQFQRYTIINYEYMNTTRFIYMDNTERPEADVIDFFMGASNGRWEGNTLVVDTTNNNDRTWFDRAGNHHSDALHVIERFTLLDRDHLDYDVTIEDPKTFTRPWKMRMPLYRRIENNAQLLEYECFAYAEDDAEIAAGAK